MTVLELPCLAALAFCVLIGLRALASPAWAGTIVRLQADPLKAGGFAEFRATYGGLLTAVHLTALIIVLAFPPASYALAVLPIAAGWMGSAVGRGLSLLLDGPKLNGRGMNPAWIGLEFALGVLIALPCASLMV